MARTISNSMSNILQELELENETYVSIQKLKALAEKYSVRSAPSLIAYRLKKEGWLIATPQRGIWEFAPASYAGAYSKNDPLVCIKAFLLANPEVKCALCMQTAAWALGIADRLSVRTEIAFPDVQTKHIPKEIKAYRYLPNLDPVIRKGAPCLQPESVFVHLAAKPSAVRSWESTLEWLPDLVFEMEIKKLLRELEGRPNSVRQRTGYLLQSMFPDAAAAIQQATDLSSKVRFGPREKALRNDETWMISDTLLPISPKEMEKVK